MRDGKGSSNAKSNTVGSAVFRLLKSETVKAIGIERRLAATHEAAAYPVLLETLLRVLRSYYPPHLIAVIAGWGLRSAVGPKGVEHNSMIKGVFQHHVELLQAIALSLPVDEWGHQPAEMGDIQQAVDTTLRLADAFVARRMIATEAITAPSAATKLSLQERLRVHTQMVRNWGTYELMLQITSDLYEPLNEATRKHHGFGTLDVIAVAKQTLEIIEIQVNDRFSLLKDIFKARSIPELVHDFFARFPGAAGNPSKFLSALDPSEALDSVRARLLSHADRWLVVNSIPSISFIAKSSNLSEERTRAILDRLSLLPGGLSACNLDHLFLANPVWLKPGIKIGDEYFFAFPQTAISFLHRILPQLCEEAGIKDTLERRRASFLEQESLRIAKRALPAARIDPAVKWTWQGETFETDILVLIDRTVFVIECKSASLTPQGLRGAPERVRRHIVDLISEPAVQSQRLEQIIILARGGDQNALAVTHGLGLNPSEIDTVIRTSVTLDDLTALASAEGELKAAGWVPKDLVLPTTLNIADFACVADILTRPSQFLHYFSRRAPLQRAANVIGFELDFLGLYLATNFDIAAPDEHYLMDITEMSREVDLYYRNSELDHSSPKPAPLLHSFMKAILDHLEARRPHGWTTMAFDLLSIGSIESQVACAEAMEDLRRTVSQTAKVSDRSAIISPNNAPDLAIVFHVFSRRERANRDHCIQVAIERALGEAERSRCLWISRMIETWTDVPYDAIGIADVN